MPIMKISKRKVYEDCEPFPEPFPHHKSYLFSSKNNILRNIQIFTVLHTHADSWKRDRNIKQKNMKLFLNFTSMTGIVLLFMRFTRQLYN